MFHLLAFVALTAAASAPCPVVADQDAAQAFVASDIAQEIAVLEVLQDAELHFAARVADLGLTGAAPLFGANPEAAAPDAVQGSIRDLEASESGAAHLARSTWPAR